MRVFPPALVPVLRDRSTSPILAEIDDELLGELLTTVYFAGLETHEGEHRAIRAVFTASVGTDLVIPDGAEAGGAPVYLWKILRFEKARPFAVSELVKLAMASTNERIYGAIATAHGELEISGLACKGVPSEADSMLELVAPRPGTLSVRSGGARLVDYERGTIVAGGEDVVLEQGPVRRALEASARAADMDPEGIRDYLHAVHALVTAMATHGRGGILVISSESEPHVARAGAYRMTRDSSITSLLRLSRRIHRPDDVSSYGFLLRNAFLTEVQRMIEEYGALTAIDGATVLSSGLALVAFGAVLPVAQRAVVDLGPRGTRHRASATYAHDHPGSVVFVASEDGDVSCMLRETIAERVLVWRLTQR
jgi:hypothetical protein